MFRHMLPKVIKIEHSLDEHNVIDKYEIDTYSDGSLAVLLCTDTKSLYTVVSTNLEADPLKVFYPTPEGEVSRLFRLDHNVDPYIVKSLKKMKLIAHREDIPVYTSTFIKRIDFPAYEWLGELPEITV